MLPSLSWSRKAQIRIQTFSAQKCKRRECLSSSSKTPKKRITHCKSWFQQTSKGDFTQTPETRCTGTPDSGFGFKSGFSFQYSAILGMSWIPNLLPQSGTTEIKLGVLRSLRTWCSFASNLGSQPLALTWYDIIKFHMDKIVTCNAAKANKKLRGWHGI